MAETIRRRPSGIGSAPDPSRGGRRWDWPLLLVCAVVALAVGLSSPPHTSQRVWGITAAAGYGCAAVVAAVSARRWARNAALVALIGAVVVPLVYLTVIDRAQMEVGVVERGADLLFHTGTPYNSDPHAVPDFNPYLPGMALFGIPRVLFGDSFLGSARLWFLVGFLAAVLGALRVSLKAGTSGGTSSGTGATPAGTSGATGFLWLIACPVVALPLTIGGVDPPVIALVCLALAFTHRGQAGRAGLALGVAAALKWTAWPAVPVVVALLWLCRGKRDALRCAAGAAGIAVLSVVPVALVDIGAFYQNVVLYPLGLGPTQSSAESPLLGSLIVSVVPQGKAVAVGLILISAMAVGASLLLRPVRDVVSAADRLALGLILAIVLSPATRIGYAIYPVVLLLWPRFAVSLSRGEPPVVGDAAAPSERAPSAAAAAAVSD
ncbi:glycosyltransferase 87 family protein [Streptomyces sp. NPDC057654]|uniref:glycosyltransferase 87 family protein n=1 Tax=Streptomyces sp. NPDC057654 TaxID=3346196 RepID=UPI003693CE1C